LGCSRSTEYGRVSLLIFTNPDDRRHTDSQRTALLVKFDASGGGGAAFPRPHRVGGRELAGNGKPLRAVDRKSKFEGGRGADMETSVCGRTSDQESEKRLATSLNDSRLGNTIVAAQ